MSQEPYSLLHQSKDGVRLMRKVDLTVTEEEKYLTIKKLVETDGNKRAAALKLDCTERHINRMIKGYREHGKEFFRHGNRGRKPLNAVPEDTRQRIVNVYQSGYWDANFKHFSELLLKREKISVSPTTIRLILGEQHIVSPMATRTTRQRVKAELLEKLKQATHQKEIAKIQDNIISLEEAHPRRPRAAHFGELLQMDASQHLWFGSRVTHLHATIDDCTGAILGAYFDEQETLKGYYNVAHQVVSTYGIPYSFLTDRRTVFEYKKKNSPDIEDDSFTQFSYACKQLGIELNTTSIPEGKGRVERLFQTLQSRLPIELRLAGVTTIEQANMFLDSYIEEFNSQFALTIDHTKSVFEKPPIGEKLNLILAVLTERKVDSGHSIRFNNKYFKTVDPRGDAVYFRKGTPCLVIKAFDEQLFGCINDQVYALEEIPRHEAVSPNFGALNAPGEAKIKTKYIPPMDHPWRRPIFKKHLDSMRHRTG